jgi:hypothetical protein
MKTRGRPEVDLPHVFFSSALGGGGQFHAPAALPSHQECWQLTVSVDNVKMKRISVPVRM